jgi:YbbR domain-containing protein
VSPDTLYFSEKTGFQKIVPVKIPLYIKCREGYGFKKPVVNPNFITIWGDTALIKSIDTIYTQPLTLNNLSQNINSNISFIKPDPEVYTSVNAAHIFIEVARLVEQTVSLPVTDMNVTSMQQVNIYPSTVKVRFTSLQNAFNENDTSFFKARIDSRKINKRSRKCTVFLNSVPANVTIMEIDPKEVEILIFRK